MAVPDPETTPDYEAEITALEQETDGIVSSTISKIESAIEAFKAAGGKPQDIKEDIIRLKGFYNELRGWEKRSLEARRGGDLESKVKRLQEFADICRRFSGAFGRAD